MKILCVIDQFGSGGAQRQMVNLATGLKSRGHHVEMFNYFPQHDFFRSAVVDANIPIYDVEKGNGFSPAVLRSLIRQLRSGGYDAAISFLNTPNAYLELASVLARPCRVIVSERQSHHGDKSRLRAALHRLFHLSADIVVTNSVAHAQWLENSSMGLRGKVETIYNGTDTEALASPFHPPARPEDTRFLAIGRLVPQKNVLGLIAAMRILRDRHGWMPTVHWAGLRHDSTQEGRYYLQKVDAELVNDEELSFRLVLLGQRSDIPALLAESHALVHPAFFEGLPNVVCEALAAGRPVVGSRISDMAILVEEGRRGFLFDPEEPSTIADAMERLVGLTSEEWRGFSHNARRYAEDKLSNAHMVERFEQILRSLTS